MKYIHDFAWRRGFIFTACEVVVVLTVLPQAHSLSAYVSVGLENTDCRCFDPQKHLSLKNPQLSQKWRPDFHNLRRTKDPALVAACSKQFSLWKEWSVGYGLFWVWGVVFLGWGFFFFGCMHRQNFLFSSLPLLSLPPVSLRNPGMPCLWSLPICICHM